jgi:hypothetical protein
MPIQGSERREWDTFLRQQMEPDTTVVGIIHMGAMAEAEAEAAMAEEEAEEVVVGVDSFLPRYRIKSQPPNPSTHCSHITKFHISFFQAPRC